MLPIELHQKKLWPMYRKCLHRELTGWLTHAEQFSILNQPVKFRWYKYIWAQN
jgi:hypothetical protein